MTLTTSTLTPTSAAPPLPFTVTGAGTVSGAPATRTASSTLNVIHDPPIHGIWTIPADGSDGVFSVAWAGPIPNDVSLVQVDLYANDPTVPTCEIFYSPDASPTNSFTITAGSNCSLVVSDSGGSWNGSVLTTNFHIQFTAPSGQLSVAFAASNGAGEDGGGLFGYFTVQ